MRATMFPTLVGRLGRPADIAALMAFLASPLAGYVNATNVHIDGRHLQLAVWSTIESQSQEPFVTLLDTYRAMMDALATGAFEELPTYVDPDTYTESCVGPDGRINWRFLLCDRNGVRRQLLGEPAPPGHPLAKPTP